MKLSGSSLTTWMILPLPNQVVIMTETPTNSSLRPLSPLSTSNVQISTPARHLSEKCKTPSTPTSASDDEMDLAKWCDDFGAADDCRDENEVSMRLSPIQHVSLNNTLAASGMSVERVTSPSADYNNASFPGSEEDVEIQSPSTPDRQEQDVSDDENEEETEEERIQREMEESEALARQMMAEEAMATYAMSIENLRANAEHFSEEDLAALQAAMAEEDPEEDEAVDSDNSQEMSYDALLRLGERIGDVKEERWACVAQDKIEKVPTLLFHPSMAEGKDENHTEVKCLICQENYEEGEELRCLPCQHCFHKDCVDTWLSTKDTCAFCRKSIESE